MKPNSASSYGKPWLSYQEQLTLLHGRGLSDAMGFESLIRQVGYYRLSGYWYVLRELDEVTGERLDRFFSDARLGSVADLYAFDDRLRSTLMMAISTVEVALRVELGHVLGKRSTFAYLEPGHLELTLDRSKYARFLSDYFDLQSRSKDDFVKHFNDKYDGVLPIWVAVEILQFGGLVSLYGFAHYDDRRQIAERLGDVHADEFKSWLMAINVVRNICAHHGRLWNRAMVNMPKVPAVDRVPELDHSRGSISRVYGVACVLAYWLRALGRVDLVAEIRATLESFPQIQGIEGSMAGIVAGWQGYALWR